MKAIFLEVVQIIQLYPVGDLWIWGSCDFADDTISFDGVWSWDHSM